MNKKAKYFIIIGLITISLVQLFLHYIHLGDFINGDFIGIGIGLLLTGIILQTKTTVLKK